MPSTAPGEPAQNPALFQMLIDRPMRRSFQIRKQGVDINLSHKAETSVPANIFNYLAGYRHFESSPFRITNSK